MIRTAEHPAGRLVVESGGIRAPAAAGVLARPIARRINWILSRCMSGLITSQSYPASTDSMDTRIYHRRSIDCHHVGIVAMVETAVKGFGELTLTADDGGGDSVTLNWDDETVRSRFDPPRWTMLVGYVEVTLTGLHYLELAWASMDVRQIWICELPRASLSATDGDTCVEEIGGAWSGLLHGRRITDSATAGIPALLAGTVAARDATRRHFLPLILPDSLAWTRIPAATTYEGIAQAALGVASGWGWRHQAQKILSSDTAQTYDLIIRAREQVAGNGTVRIYSDGTSDYADFAQTSSWAWSVGEIDIDATAIDTLIPYAYNTDGATQLELASVQMVRQ